MPLQKRMYHFTVATAECEDAFNRLNTCLITPPVLAYPDFKSFILEADGSILELPTLSQLQEDEKLHPLTYASHLLPKLEKKYPITELETLAAVCGVTRFRY